MIQFFLSDSTNLIFILRFIHIYNSHSTTPVATLTAVIGMGPKVGRMSIPYLSFRSMFAAGDGWREFIQSVGPVNQDFTYSSINFFSGLSPCQSA